MSYHEFVNAPATVSETRMNGEFARMATATGVAVQPHVWNSGAIIAAAVQFAASSPDYPQLENVPEPKLLEFDRSENSLRSEILEEPFDPTSGSLSVPSVPGLGTDADEEAVERFRIER